jgi:hypothetical protein
MDIQCYTERMTAALLEREITTAKETTTTKEITTIKVTKGTRARLRQLAGGSTVERLLERLIEEEEERRFIEGLKEDIAATSPELMESWRRETAAWETTELEDQRW